MIKRILFITAFCFFGTLATAEAATLLGSYDDWEAFTDRENGKLVCYMGAEPTKARGKYKKRGKTYILVTHRPTDKNTNVVTVQAGYTYKKGSETEVIIGSKKTLLFVDGGHAFAYDSRADNELVRLMIRGVGLTVKGVSTRGTLTTDTYSLKGFTAAYKAISAACKV